MNLKSSLTYLSYLAISCNGLSLDLQTRRGFAASVAAASGFIANTPAFADTDIDSFLKTGGVAMPMGVSGQAGKAKPETGVVLREGSEVARAANGDVLAEILVKSSGGDDLMPVVATFTSPWSLATGSLFDVECRDATTGDGAFMAVSPSVSGSALSDLKDSFFVKTVFSSKGRFSFYGQPTDIKVKSSAMKGNYKVLDVGFSTLSQSTQTEIPRRAQIIATIPPGSDQAVMLVGSASALRWKSKGADKLVLSTIDSFKAIPAPTSMKIRAKDMRSS